MTSQEGQLINKSLLTLGRCVSALTKEKGTVLSVFNYADKDAVNGEPENTANGTVLCARQKDSSVGGALLVAPCFLPNSLAGDYWILAVGESEAGTGELEWAVISGG